MKLTFSVKTPWPKKNMPDTGWEVEEVDAGSGRLSEILAGKPFGHSLMIWHGGHRHASKLQFRTGIMVDIDNDTTYVALPVTRRQIQGALREVGCGYILCPSKSHLIEKPATKAKPAQPAVERWHVYIPFAAPAKSSEPLEKAVANFIVKHFGTLGADPVFDGARYFGPGITPDLITVFDGHALQPDWLIGHYANLGLDDAYKRTIADRKTLSRGGDVAPNAPGAPKPKGSKGAVKAGEYWRKKQEVTLADNTTVLASQIDEKTPCRCINPTHADEHASAFVAFNEDGLQYIHCKSCNMTWWEKDWMSTYLERLFYVDSELNAFYGNEDVSWDVGRFPQNGIIAPTPEARTGLLAILAKTPLCRAKLLVARHKGGLAPASASKDVERSILNMVEPMTPDRGSDPKAVESWYHALFGEHAEFLMNWTALYAFGNFLRLPVIVLNGPRGSGKSGFAELLCGLYPSHSRRWEADKTGFNDELDSFLVHVDELPAAEHGRTENKAFYRTLKSLTGGANISINRKYGLKYEVQNNLSVVITTNDMDPIHLDPFEKATDTANNQFFVYTMPQALKIDLVRWKHVQDAFPNWVRTNGHARYTAWLQGTERHQARYGLRVPITAQEEAAYEESKTEIERLGPALWIALKTQRYNGRFFSVNADKGFFTTQDFAALAATTDSGHSGLHLNKLFRRYGWLEAASSVHRSGPVLLRGYCPTPEGLALWAEAKA